MKNQINFCLTLLSLALLLGCGNKSKIAQDEIVKLVGREINVTEATHVMNAVYYNGLDLDSALIQVIKYKNEFPNKDNVIDKMIGKNETTEDVIDGINQFLSNPNVQAYCCSSLNCRCTDSADCVGMLANHICMDGWYNEDPDGGGICRHKDNVPCTQQDCSCP